MKRSSSLTQSNRFVKPYTSYGQGFDSDVPVGSRPMRTIACSLACFLLVATVGCASWLMKGEPPEVLVTNVTPLEATAFEQRLQVDLRIRNPNDFDLLVTGIDFTLNLNGKRLARGLGNKDITGLLHLKDGRLPFDNSGILLEKGQLSGAPSP